MRRTRKLTRLDELELTRLDELGAKLARTQHEHCHECLHIPGFHAVRLTARVYGVVDTYQFCSQGCARCFLDALEGEEGNK